MPTPLSSSDEIIDAGDYIFRNFPTDAAQVVAMVEFLGSKDFKNYAPDFTLDANPSVSNVAGVGKSVHNLYESSIELKADVLTLVGPVGFEPTTFGLKVRCSTELSYRPDAISSILFSGTRWQIGCSDYPPHLFARVRKGPLPRRGEGIPFPTHTEMHWGASFTTSRG